MIIFFKKFFNLFFYDELAFVRWMRGFMLMAAAGGIGFADSLAALLESPTSARYIKIVALICGFIGGTITAGQKNQAIQTP